MKVSEEIRSLIPYKPGKPIEETKRDYNLTEVVKLASNENPLGPSPKVLSAIQEALPEIHRYPDASCFQLSEKLSGKLGIDKNQIVFGNGSNELIDLVIRVFCEPGSRVLMSDKSFIAYKICAQAARVETKEFAMGNDLKIDASGIAEYFETTNDPKDRVLFIANPNNPTGSYMGNEEILRICEATKGRDNFMVILDEAYNEFVRAPDYPDALELVKKYKHVVNMRTMGKVYGLAGIRIGYMIAHPEHCDYIHRVRNPFNVNSLAQVAALAALDDQDYLQKAQQTNWAGLDYFYNELESLRLPFIRSEANFVLFDSRRNGGQFTEELLKKGLIVRPMAGYGLPRHIRLSVGLESENQFAMKRIKEVLDILPEESH